MPSALWIRGTVIAAAAIATGIVWVTGHGVDIPYIKALVTASGVVTVAVFIYDGAAWRWPGLRTLTSRPVLHGTWKAELQTSFTSRETEIIEAYLVVRQTFSRISVSMLFDRSRSRSMVGDLVFEDRTCVLYYLFRTEAGTLHRDGNPPARGGAAVIVNRWPSMHLEGDYWTERETRGHVRTVGRTTKIYDTFSAAQSGTYASGID
jgi:hypothetical protein